MIPIAIVDDEQDSINNLKEQLAFIMANDGVECKVEEFTDAYSFFMHFENQYSIVFLDIQMPGMDGYSCAQIERVG
ncbi:MAG: response regulator [Clostridia bacterium]|nr:response regulator [Clostridia bacterium]